MSTLKVLGAGEVQQRLAQGEPGTLIDVRSPVEFREIHARGAVNIPAHRVSVEALPAGPAPVYLLCRNGGRAATACRRLAAAGLSDVYVVEGGTQAWMSAGLPVECGAKTVSLERQVRIAAGTIVFAGSALAAFVSPWFIGLPAFIGAGLTFAGITDSCAMGMLMAQMPWNQRGVPVGTS